MKTPKIPEAFDKMMAGFFLCATDEFSSGEQMVDWALGLLRGNERPIAGAYLDELLSGKYDEEELRAMWRSSRAHLLPFWEDEGSCTEFLQFIRSRFDEFERRR